MSEGSDSPIDKKHVALAKTRVARWLDATNQPAIFRSKVLAGVDSIARELPTRADWLEVTTVFLDESAGVNIAADAPCFRAFQCKDGIAVSTIVPSWAKGWSKIFNDEEVHQILSWFLHYARQYIHRSYVASVLMIVWEEKQAVLDPFGSRLTRVNYNSMREMSSPNQALEDAKYNAFRQWGASDNPNAAISSSISPWLRRNTLDPYLHQAVFHYLRGQKLSSNDFAMEAIVAFDCAMQSVVTFVRDRFHLPSEPTRRATLEILGVSSKFGRSAEYAYFLRNNFGAHAGGWRWWDQHELLEDGVLEEIVSVVEASLGAAADQEPSVRLIEPAPLRWADWLFENFEMLWDAVWFERIDNWDRRLGMM